MKTFLRVIIVVSALLGINNPSYNKVVAQSKADSNCLEFADKSLQILNPRAGTITPDQRPQDWWIGGYDGGTPSPNRRYWAHEYHDGPNDIERSLAIEDTKTNLLTRIQNHVRDGLWSSDSSYYAYWWDSAGKAAISIIQADGINVKTINTDFPIESFNLEDWSEDGNYLLFDITSTGKNTRAGLLSIRNWQIKTFDLSGSGYTSWIPRGNQWAVNTAPDKNYVIVSPDGVRPVPADPVYSMGTFPGWSPKGHYFTLLHLSYPDAPPDPRDVQHYSIFDVSGSEIKQIAKIVASPGMRLLSQFWWAPDERTVLYLQIPDDTQEKPLAQLMSFHVQENRTEVLVDRVLPNGYLPGDYAFNNKPVSLWPSGLLLLNGDIEHKGVQRLAVPIRQRDGSTKVDMMNFDGTDRITVYAGTDEVQHTETSPDGKFFLLSTSSGSQHTLRWMNLDGSASRSVTIDNVKSVYDFYWTNDSAWLIYGVELNNEDASKHDWQTVVINTQTGIVHHLVGKAQGFESFQPSDAIDLWTNAPDGTIGVDEYTLDGTYRYHFQSLSTTFGDHPQFKTYYYVAPDGHAAVLTFGALGKNQSGNDSFQFAIANSSNPPHVIESDVYAVEEALWSPDSAMVAVTYPLPNGRAALRVLDRNGADVWYSDQDNATIIQWITCN